MRLRPWIIAIAFLAFACDEGLLDELPDAKNLGACLAPVDGWRQLPGLAGFDISLTGIVIDRGSGDPPAACFERPFVGWRNGAAKISWLEVDDGDERWVLALSLPGFEPAALGQGVRIEFSYAPGGFSPSIGHVFIADEEGPSAWIGQGGDPGDLVLPEMIETVRPGATVYRELEDCGTWEAYELEVQTSGGGVTLEYGESEDHDSASLFHGGYRHDIGGKSNCADWFVADLSLGWRRE